MRRRLCVTLVMTLVVALPLVGRAAFLEQQLPLSLSLAMPAALRDGRAVELYDRQSLTAVFSRAVIALGSDFGGPLPNDKIPFLVDGGPPGRGRWATSYVYRWDPDVPWPSDLAATLLWNKNLTTYDGVALQQLNASTVPLSSEPLNMWLAGVVSEAASNATGGRWQPQTDPNGALEVPPDGKLLLHTSSPVNMSMLKEALVVQQRGGKDTGATLTLEACPELQYVVLDVLPPGSGGGGEQELGSTCVAITMEPPPAAGAQYDLVLPNGARYNSLSGPLRKAAKLPFDGLRPFALPFLPPSESTRLRFQRLSLLLPHGLAAGTPLEALQQALSLYLLDGAPPPAGAGGNSMPPYEPEPRPMPLPGGYADYGSSDVAGSFIGKDDPDATYVDIEIDGSHDAAEVEEVLVEGEMEVDGDEGEVASERDAAVSIAGRRRHRRRRLLSPHVIRQHHHQPRHGLLEDGPSPAVEGGPFAAFEGQAGQPVAPIGLTAPDDSRTLVQLAAPLLPGRVYRLEVAASEAVKDGFGQPLQAGSTHFATAPLPGLFAEPDLARHYYGGEYGISFQMVDESALVDLTDESWDGSWPLLARAAAEEDLKDYDGEQNYYDRATAQEVGAWRVALGDDAATTRLLQMMVLGRAPAGTANAEDSYVVHLHDILGEPSATLQRQAAGPNDAGVGLDAFDARALLADGVLAKQACCMPPDEQPWQPEYLQGTSVSVNALVLSAPTAEQGESRRVVVWVTGLSGGAPVAGATVQLWNVTQSSAPLKPLLESSTDAEGLASLNISSIATKDEELEWTLALVVRYGGDGVAERGLVLGQLSLPSAGGTPYRGALVADHPLLRPGDPLRLLGYVWTSAAAASADDSLALSVPTADLARNGAGLFLRVVRSFQGEEGNYWWNEEEEPPTFPVTLDPQLGSFNASIPVPLDAVPGTDTVELVLRLPSAAPKEWEGEGEVVLDSLAVTVSDPRPPTVQLELDAPAWSDPRAPIAVTARVRSYIGSDVEGAELTVSWTLDTYGNTSSGVLEGPVRTNSRGEATISLPIFGEAAAPGPGSRGYWSPAVEVAVEWVGPTRERLHESAIIKLQTSPLTLALTRSLETHVPGIPFSLAASVSDLDARNLTDLPVTATLSRNGSAEVLQTCAFVAGARTWSDCSLQLPGLGAYEVEACVEDGEGRPACVSEVLGKDEAGWAEAPLAEHPRLNVLTQGDAERVSVSVDVPYQGGWVLLLWGNGLAQRTRVAALQQGVQELALEPGSECAGGCTLQAVLSIPRQASGEAASGPVAAAAAVPTSIAFDPAAPHTITATPAPIHAPVNISVPASLSVGGGQAAGGGDAGDDEAPVFAPGQQVTLSLKLDAPQGAAGDQAQVSFIVVDQSLLDLLPPDDPTLATDLAPARPLGLSLATSYALMLRRAGALTGVADVALQRLRADPWLAPGYNDMSVWPETGADTPLDKYLREHSSFATYDFHGQEYQDDGANMLQPGETAYMLMPEEANLLEVAAGGPRMATAAAQPRAESASDKTAGSGAVPRLTDQFEGTPLFAAAAIDASGTATLSFKAPNKLGAYAVRAFVVTSGGRFAQLAGELVVRSPLSLVPSAPRFVRLGDAFETGVVVTAPGAPQQVPVTLTARVDEGGVLALDGSAQRSVTLPPRSSGVEVRFTLRALALGRGALTVTADGNGDSDAIKVAIPVEPRQEPVFVASSFALGSTNADADGSAWQEGLDLPDAVPGSGFINITAGVGQLPVLQALAARGADATPRKAEDAAADWALWAATTPAVLRSYGGGVTVDDGVTGAAAVAREQLGSGALTLPDLGLVYVRWLGTQYEPGTRPDAQLNAWGVWLAGRVAALGTGASEWGPLQDEVKAWSVALDTAMVDGAREARKRGGRYSDYDTLALAHLALGAGWKPTAGAANAALQADLSLQRLMDGKEELSTLARAAALLALAGAPEATRAGAAADMDALAVGLTDALRVRGRTAYVATASASNTAAGAQAQALALLALLESGREPASLLSPLAAHLAQVAASAPSAGPIIMPAPSGIAAAAAAVALGAYDDARGNTDPSLQVTASAQSQPLLSAAFSSPAAPPAAVQLPWSSLPPSAPRLDFEAKGSGEVAVVVGLRFVPAAMPPAPLYRGIAVQRVVQAVNGSSPTGEAEGPALAALTLGSQVRVTVRTTTPDDLGAAVVRVLLPGGLEAVDPNVASDASAATQCPLDGGFSGGDDFSLDSYGGGGGGGFSLPPWRWCPTVVVYPQAVELRYSHMGAGTHEASFLAVAASAGTWLLPPTVATATAEPELSGLSEGSSLLICDPKADESCSPKPAEAQPQGRDCPGNCSGAAGMCDVSRGVCLCMDGYAGEDCSELARA